MAYPDHYLFQFGGTLHGTEQWSNNLRLVPNAGGVVETAETTDMALADLEADLRAFFATPTFHTGLRCTFAKLNRIGPDGRYLSKTSTNARFFATPIAGTATSCHAPQVTVAASLTTAAVRGLASRGRIYLPGLSGAFGPVVADGLLSASQANTLRDAVATFLNNVNNWPGLDATWAGLDISVVSDGGLSGVGQQRKVTGVRVGRVLDTQRRRRHSLVESYNVPAAVS